MNIIRSTFFFFLISRFTLLTQQKRGDELYFCPNDDFYIENILNKYNFLIYILKIIYVYILIMIYCINEKKRFFNSGGRRF